MLNIQVPISDPDERKEGWQLRPSRMKCIAHAVTKQQGRITPEVVEAVLLEAARQ